MREMETQNEVQIERDLRSVRIFLLNFFEKEVENKLIVSLGKIKIIALAEFNKDLMSQTREARGYAAVAKKVLPLTVYYRPYSRKLSVKIGHVHVEFSMEEIIQLTGGEQ
jgi:hypothetical protein